MFLNMRVYTSYIIILLFLSSCNVTKTYVKPEINTDSLFRTDLMEDTASISHLAWSELYTDSALQRLIEEGLNNNPELEVAYMNIQKTEAYYKQSRSAYFPDLELFADVEVSHIPEDQRTTGGSNRTLYSAGLMSAWEADVWGKLKSSKRAEWANVLATTEAAKAIKTRLIATIAIYYYQLLAMDEQLEITEKTIENWRNTVVVMQELKEAATVTEAAVVQSEAQQYAAEVTIPDLKQAIRETENALAILLGRSPETIRRSEMKQQQLPDSLQAGVPSQLLANRPDVFQAELQFRRQFELSNVARTYFYPSLSIGGTAGFSTQKLNAFFNPASFLANIGAGLTQSVFNKRLNKTRLEIALLEEEEAFVNFKVALLEAGKEVSDALSLYEMSGEKINIRRKQVSSLEKAAEYTQELLENGFANYTEVITARQSLLQAELGSVNDRLERLISVVNLYRALGGG